MHSLSPRTNKSCGICNSNAFAMESIKVSQLFIREETSISANDAHQSQCGGLPLSADHSSLAPNKSIRWDVCRGGICVFHCVFKKAKKKSQCFSSSLQLTGCQTGLRAFLTAPPPRHGCDDDPCAPFTRKRLLFFFLRPLFFHVGEIGRGPQEAAATVLAEVGERSRIWAARQSLCLETRKPSGRGNYGMERTDC